MKEIIYLDTEILHSYLAQLNNGLIMNKTTEESEQLAHTTEKSEGAQSRTSTTIKANTGSFELPFFIKSPTGEMILKWEPGKNQSEKSILAQTEFGKEVLSIQLHDNALNTFEEYLKNSNSFQSQNIGDFIHIKSSFKLIDINYLKQLLSHEKLVDLMLSSEIQESLTKLNNPKEYAALEKEIQKQRKNLTKEYQHIRDIVSFLETGLPTDAFFLLDGYIIPVRKDFLRQSSDLLTFKYGTNSPLEISVLGKVSSSVKITNSQQFDSNQNPFEEISNLPLIILESMNILKRGDRVISPIAIYFE